MSSLSPIEKRYLEDLLEMSGGYVLDLTNDKFAELFRDTLKINIYDEKYITYGDSKAKRLRAFWNQESDIPVGNALGALLEQWKYEQTVNNKPTTSDRFAECLKISKRLKGEACPKESSENDFLHRDFEKPNLSALSLDFSFESVIGQRIAEIEKSLNANAPLATIFLCGSTLEGLLLDCATKNPREFNSAKASPKDIANKVKPFHEWTLSNLIDVAYEAGKLEQDIKKFSHNLRDFRNYIHPRQQSVEQFSPDKHTAEISWKILQATIESLCGRRNSR